MLAYVKRTTIKISDALDARLRHEAQRRNLTISEISREALDACRGRADISERIEEILAAEVGR